MQNAINLALPSCLVVMESSYNLTQLCVGNLHIRCFHIQGFPLLYFVTSGSKPMDTWCGDEVNMGNSWDQEEEVEIGMWSNSQQDNRPNDQNTWNYKHKGSYKVSRVHIFSKLQMPQMSSGCCRMLRNKWSTFLSTIFR